MLNLPNSVNKKLEGANTILIVGAGGDVLCGLPLYYTFLKQGKKVHLANLTHTNLETINDHADPIVLGPGILGATSTIKMQSQNFVEGYLSQYFKATMNQDNIVWMINRTHVQDLKKSFQRLVEHLKIEAIVLVDGGVDSIMRGDEIGNVLTSKFVDTTLILSVVQQMESIHENVILMSYFNGIKNTQVFNVNVSAIASQGGFYGGCYLVDFMNSYKLMKSAYIYEKNNGNVSSDLEQIIKIVEIDFEENELDRGLVQCLFFNPLALIYNNSVVHKIIEANSYYDIIQAVAPLVNKVS